MQWSEPQPQNSFMRLLFSHFADKKVETKGENKIENFQSISAITNYKDEHFFLHNSAVCNTS